MGDAPLFLHLFVPKKLLQWHYRRTMEPRVRRVFAEFKARGIQGWAMFDELSLRPRDVDDLAALAEMLKWMALELRGVERRA